MNHSFTVCCKGGEKKGHIKKSMYLLTVSFLVLASVSFGGFLCLL